MPHLETLIRKFLEIYPQPLRRLLNGSVFVSQEERVVGGERVDGSYDLETGQVILWHPEGANEEDLFIILAHEWGHKVYHEWLLAAERSDWLIIRSEEKIDFELSQSYPLVKLPEEEYCTIFCIVSEKLYLKRTGMKIQEDKLASKMKKELPLFF